ncbi:MAG: hypothetical protein GTO63_17195 [Anaerolineae bacterium]|nr:hypothetical protein [Anaerolineae bacterium]NIN96529.1 hypothetical protein [Anaerolineae bacterium]NIQ79558.1 hypothetical protein [Anaerolineae bacterium]
MILANIAGKAIGQLQDTVREIIEDNGMERTEAIRIAKALPSGKWTHDHPISLEEVKRLGLPALDYLPKEVYGLMELCPQAGRGRPSVQHIPAPYWPLQRKHGGRGERG